MPITTKFPPANILERLGVGSYTIYLVHVVAVPASIALIGHLFGTSPLILRWGFVAFWMFLFYFIAEQPSHRLAQFVGRRAVPQTAATIRTGSA